MSTDTQNAIKQSLNTEKNAMLFYQYGAAQFTDPRAKKTFEQLAAEEREHAGHFFRIYQGGDIRSLDEFLAAAPDNESSWIAAVKKACGSDFTEKHALELAMEKEQALEAALRDLSAKVTDTEVKAVYDLNVRETHNHYLIIEAEYARIMGMVDETDMDTYVRE